MLRVSKVDDWLRRAPTRPDLSAHGDCVSIRSSERHGPGAAASPVPGKGDRATGPQAQTGSQRARVAGPRAHVAGPRTRLAGAKALHLGLVMIPPGTCGMPHFHADRESAIYTVSGETEIWHGDGLVKRYVVRAGDFMYVPPGTPHLAVNRCDVMTIAVTASTDPEEREDMGRGRTSEASCRRAQHAGRRAGVTPDPAPASRGEAAYPVSVGGGTSSSAGSQGPLSPLPTG